MVLGTVRREGGPPKRWPKALEAKLLEEDHQAPVHSDQMVLVIVSGRLDLMRGSQSHSRESWKTTLEIQQT
jgi:hypothetical protein